MKKTFLICSLYGRISGLVRLVTSLEKYADEWYLDVVLQNYPVTEQAIIEVHCEKVFKKEKVKIFTTSEMTGPHLARCRALDADNSDIWCILDDDMFAVEGFTDYDIMAEKLWKRQDIGILSSNWRKTRKMLDNVRLSGRLEKQVIVYTGGGMMLRQDVADIIKAIPRVQYLFDNPLWSIYSYVNGYDNYRYLGSAAVHEICTKGGRRKWLKENDKYKSLPPEMWLRVRKGKGKEGGFDEYLICDSSDVTEEARRLHKENKL